MQITRKQLQQGYTAICTRYGSVQQKDEVVITNCDNVEDATEKAYLYFLINTYDVVLRKIQKIEIIERGKLSHETTKIIYTKNY